MAIDSSLATIYVTPNLDQASVTTSISPAGGAILTFTGSNLCKGSLQYVTIRDRNSDFSQSVTELQAASGSRKKRDTVAQVQIQIPAITVEDPSNLDLYVDFGDSTEFDLNLCDETTAPKITEIVNSLTQDANNGNLIIRGEFAATQSNSWVKIDEIDLQVDSWSETEIIVSSAENLTQDEYELTIYFDNEGNCAGYARYYTPGKINVNLKYTNIYPSNPSFLGGETYEIHGSGFTSNLEEISIRDFNGYTCDVLSASPNLSWWWSKFT